VSFTNEKTVKAVRKPAQCCACGKMIEIGESAVRWAGMTDGDFSSVAYHPDCRQAEVEINRLHDTYFDEWFGLSEIEWEDHRWLLETHPAVAARMGITLAKIKETEREREASRLAWAEIDRKRREATPHQHSAGNGEKHGG